MADFDPNSLLQNPLFLSGVGILGSKGNNVSGNIAQGIESAQQSQLGPIVLALKQMELQRQKNAMAFNPADFMQTDQSEPNGLLSANSTQQQAASFAPQQIPAAIGGPMGQAMPQATTPSQQQVQFAPGAPIGEQKLDLPGLVTAGIHAGLPVSEIQGAAMAADPAYYAKLQALTKSLEPYTLEPGAIRGNPALGNAPTENTNPPPSSELGQLTALTKARDQYPQGSPQWNVLDSAIRQKSGQASQEFRQKALDNANYRLYGDPQTNDRIAQGIANYTLAPASLGSYSSPQKNAIMARVQELNPNFNAQNYAISQKTRQSFTTGTQGNTLRSMNVGIEHLQTLVPLVDALQNGDVQAINRLSNVYKEQFGGTAPTNFDAAKAIVADEVTKAIVGSQNALGDREQLQKALDAAKSPAQLKGVIQTWTNLMGGQLKGLRQQYAAGTFGGQDFEKYLTPNAKAAVEGGNYRVPVRTGTVNGKRVIQYSDGSMEYK